MTDTTAALILDGLAGLDVEDESGDFPSPEVRLALGSIFGKSTVSSSVWWFNDTNLHICSYFHVRWLLDHIFNGLPSDEEEE